MDIIKFLSQVTDYVQPTRNFSLAYVIFDSIFVVFFMVMLFVMKRKVTFYWALAGGILYFLVDFLIFYLATGSREIYTYLASTADQQTLLSSGETAAVLFWMSMSYGILDFAFIWIWLSNDEKRIEFTLAIVVWWICCPLISSMVENSVDTIPYFMTTRGTGKYHGAMGLIMALSYFAVIVYNLVIKDKSKKVPLLRIFLIGFMAQFLWEAALLIFGIRSQIYEGDIMRTMSTMIQNSLVETNLGLPSMFFIHRFVSSRWKEDCSRLKIEENKAVEAN